MASAGSKSSVLSDASTSDDSSWTNSRTGSVATDFGESRSAASSVSLKVIREENMASSAKDEKQHETGEHQQLRVEISPPTPQHILQKEPLAENKSENDNARTSAERQGSGRESAGSDASGGAKAGSDAGAGTGTSAETGPAEADSGKEKSHVRVNSSANVTITISHRRDASNRASLSIPSDARGGSGGASDGEAAEYTDVEEAVVTQSKDGSARNTHIVKRRSKKKKYKKIDKSHPEFELTYDMMLGIRTTVGKVESKPERELIDPDDFEEVTRLRFRSEGTRETPPHQMRDFKFKDYAPEVFRRMRDRFGIKPANYLLRVCGNFDFLEFISNSKSGQFFFYTYDRSCMIKTITQAESKYMRKILPFYYRHVMDYPNTLLTRFYGMHRVKPHKKRETHFLIFGSVFNTSKYIHHTFDLKGSSQGRSASETEKKQFAPVLKDNDLLEMGMRIKLGPARAKLLKQQIAADVEVLRQHNIMDYSMLLGIHYEGRPAPMRKFRGSGTFRGPSTSSMLAQSSGAAAMVRSASARAVLSSGATFATAAAATTKPPPQGTLIPPPMPSLAPPVAESAGAEDENSVAASVEESKGEAIEDADDADQRQSTYAVPPDYDALSHPQDINFVAPEFPRIDEAKLNRTVTSVQPVHSLFTHDDGGMRSMDENGNYSDEIYYMGIIDVLTFYGMKKAAESLAKSVKYKRRTISAVHPDRYAARFKEFMDKIIV